VTIANGEWWPAPAKLNLFLHITGRHTDGYHNLQTVFQLLDWCDEIQIESTAESRIERLSGAADIAPEQDLTVRAARLLQQTAAAEQTPLQRGAKLRVRKCIPTGGGLGGGSSDAATVLLVLNRLWGLHYGTEQLAALGLRLGADVPVFVRGQSAWGEGRGEQLTPVELPEYWFLVLHPGVGVSTASVFQAPDLTRNTAIRTIRALSPADLAGGHTRNDCEAVVRERVPAVAEALDWLRRAVPVEVAPTVRMSGTGSCIFAAFANAAEAERVAARVPDEWSSRVARGVERSPLHQRLQQD
jgi:4-diphosphocytidyl-2-C-methyl-D-erythritol kinase